MSKKNNGHHNVTSNQSSVVSSETENRQPETDKQHDEGRTKYTKSEKSELIANYQIACDELRVVETECSERVRTAKNAKSDAAFKLQQAFGDEVFSVAGVYMKVRKATGRGSDATETKWTVTQVNTNVSDENSF